MRREGGRRETVKEGGRRETVKGGDKKEGGMRDAREEVGGKEGAGRKVAPYIRLSAFRPRSLILIHLHTCSLLFDEFLRACWRPQPHHYFIIDISVPFFCSSNIFL